MRGKIPDFTSGHVYDQEVQDRDAEQKAKTKAYADDRRGAQYSEVIVGDEVLVRQEKTNKLSTPFNPTPHTVIRKKGSGLIVESPSGAQYSRNTSHVKKYISEPLTTEMVEGELEAPESTTTEIPPDEPEVSPELDKLTAQDPRPQRSRTRPKHFDDYIMK